MLGAVIPQTFWVQRCSKGSGCRDTPKILHVEVRQWPWVQRHPKKFWVQRCSRDPKSFLCGYTPDTPKVLGKEMLQRPWV